MRDRLRTIILDSEILCHTCGESTDSYCAEAIADLLLANGVIVPPCKVGDTVYFIGIDENADSYIDKGRVYAVSKCEDTVWFSARYLSGLRYDHTSSDYGKKVFLSREEAEATLKGGEG